MRLGGKVYKRSSFERFLGSEEAEPDGTVEKSNRILGLR
jgi:hypothetical protein